MKTLSILGLLATALSVSTMAAEVTISDVHLCCKSCVTGVEKAVGEVQGVSVAVDKDARTVKLTGADDAQLQQAANALVAAGYFGKVSNHHVHLSSKTGAKGKTVQSLNVEGVHLCCAKCVKAVDEALSQVPGVKGNTAAKGVKSFEVTGEFNDKQVFAALQKAGLTGKTE